MQTLHRSSFFPHVAAAPACAACDVPKSAKPGQCLVIGIGHFEMLTPFSPLVQSSHAHPSSTKAPSVVQTLLRDGGAGLFGLLLLLGLTGSEQTMPDKSKIPSQHH